MPRPEFERIAIASLAELEDVAASIRARHVITLIDPGTVVRRPMGIAAAEHLRIDVHDIAAASQGQVIPGERHVAEVLAYGARWGWRAPLVVHCWAGVSRSTAAAFALMCQHAGPGHEAACLDLIYTIRPIANPNRRIVAIADKLLGRGGAMIDAADERRATGATATLFRPPSGSDQE